MQIAIVDTGYGNLRSVERATEAAAREVSSAIEIVRSADPEVIRRADRIVFPGQGAFRDCAAAINNGIQEAVLEKIRSGTPFLGICIGLQLLFESSDEAPGCPGLGWFKGRVTRLDPAGVKIPHMGWNQLEIQSDGHPCLTAAGGNDAWVYFVHSYHAEPTEPDVQKAVVSYGKNRITAAVARDNVLATQFHPEKSQRVGALLLQEFLRV